MGEKGVHGDSNIFGLINWKILNLINWAKKTIGKELLVRMGVGLSELAICSIELEILNR